MAYMWQMYIRRAERLANMGQIYISHTDRFQGVEREACNILRIFEEER